jgi:hypothetical protein
LPNNRPTGEYLSHIYILVESISIGYRSWVPIAISRSKSRNLLPKPLSVSCSTTDALFRCNSLFLFDVQIRLSTDSTAAQILKFQNGTHPGVRSICCPCGPGKPGPPLTCTTSSPVPVNSLSRVPVPVVLRPGSGCHPPPDYRSRLDFKTRAQI